MPLKKPLFGGNWKMNYGPTETVTFVEAFVDLYEPREDRTVVFFPPAISIGAFREAAAARPDLLWGVQDIHWEEGGAFTGSISASMARDAGASFVLAGHSERRHIFGDTDDAVKRKVNAIVSAGLTPVLCVGEQLKERDRGEVEAVIDRQVSVGLSELGDDDIGRMVIAYEPVWAIGTGRTASPQDANEVHELIRALLVSRVGDAVASVIPIIYGGSVKTGNVEELLSAPEIEGALVGGASLKPADFAELCRAG